MTDYVKVGKYITDSYSLNSEQFEISGTTLQLKGSGVLLTQPTTDVVINESGGDFNLRIEGDADANLFFLDAGLGGIGIGSAIPNAKLSVQGTLSTINIARFSTSDYVSGTTGSGLFVRTGAATGDTYVALDAFKAGFSTYGILSLNSTGGQVGININAPTVSDGYGLHIAGKILRLGTAKTPANAGDTGNVGEICWDTGYLYLCTATNAWERVAVATWP